MFPETLVPEREATTEDLDEALALLETDFSIATGGTTLASLRIGENGAISWGGEAYPMTEAALEAVCRIVEIPLYFAHRVPFDLLRQNIDRLKIEMDRRVALALCQNVVVNVIAPGRLGYLPAKSRDVVEKIATVGLPLNLRAMRLSVRGIAVSLVAPSFGVLEPQVGDITEVGLRVASSESGYGGLKASLYLERLVCSNGATLGEAWGGVFYWSYDARMSY